jgi:hypothetical protein
MIATEESESVQKETIGCPERPEVHASGVSTVEYDSAARSEPIACRYAADRLRGPLAAGSPHSDAIVAASSRISAAHCRQPQTNTAPRSYRARGRLRRFIVGTTTHATLDVQ